MKKALVLVLTIAALLFSPGLQTASANAANGEDWPDSVLPPGLQD